jgi:hypothetical protein
MYKHSCASCEYNKKTGEFSNYCSDSKVFWQDHEDQKPPVLKELEGTWYDTVSKPKHYMLFEDKGIEVRDVIQKLVTKVEQSAAADKVLPDGMFIADYVQLMQYLMRFMDKNGLEDLKKARWYLDKLIGAYEAP